MGKVPDVEIMPAQSGQPTTYRKEYCDLLVRHMENGHSYESFAAIIKTHRSTLYNWEKDHSEFFDAKSRGKEASLLFWENLGKLMASGQLARIVSEEPILDKDGNPMRNANGDVAMRRQYAPAMGNSTVWIFAMKNMHGWRDINRRDSEVLPSAPGAGEMPQGMPRVIEELEHLSDEEYQSQFNAALERSRLRALKRIT